MPEPIFVGFIGAGNMAEAMAGALIASGKVKSKNILLCDLEKERLSHLETQYNVCTTDSACEVFERASCVVLSVKPQAMGPLLETISEKGAHRTSERKPVITIAAGLPLSFYEAHLYKNLASEEAALLPLVRVMPNTPSLVLAGMSGLCANKNATEKDLSLAESLLASMGRVLRVKESFMDGVTAVSGSGPAYIFYMVEAMAQAAENMGFSKEEAKLLSITTLNGAAKLLDQTGEDPKELRRRVTSPGGTTEAAITTMINENIAEKIEKAMQAAARRSKELSQPSSP